MNNENTLKPFPEISQEKARAYYEALQRLSKYQSSDELLARGEEQYGLEGSEALEMAYDNMQAEVRYALSEVNK